jgi:hypothetical protein
MTHDLMQTYAALSGYPGVTTPFGSPYAGLQGAGIGMNPLAFSPFGQQGYAGIPGYGANYPQQQFGPQQQFNPLQNPIVQQVVQQALLHAALQNPILHNPLLQNPLLQNPLLLQHLQNPLVNPLQAQLQAHWVAQQTAPWAQGGYPLAPQTYLGQGGQFGGGIGYGQVHPLSQLVGRGIQNPGISSWAGI